MPARHDGKLGRCKLLQVARPDRSGRRIVHCLNGKLVPEWHRSRRIDWGLKMPPRRRIKTKERFLLPVAARLKAVREFRGLTQPEVNAVADALLGRTAYARYETATREMGHETAARVCRGFGITLDLLTFGDIGADMWARDPLLCAHLLRHKGMDFQDVRPHPTASRDTTLGGATKGSAYPLPDDTPSCGN